MAASSKAVMNSKIVSFDATNIANFIAKRKKDSGYITKLAGRELEQIKRINVTLTKKVINGYAIPLPQNVQVEVFPQVQG